MSSHYVHPAMRIVLLVSVILGSVAVFLVIHFLMIDPMLQAVRYGEHATNCTVIDKTIKSKCGKYVPSRYNTKKYCKNGYLCVLEFNYTDNKGIQRVGKANTPHNILRMKKTPAQAMREKECHRHHVNHTYTCYYNRRNPDIAYTSNAPVPELFAFYSIPFVMFVAACVGIVLWIRNRRADSLYPYNNFHWTTGQRSKANKIQLQQLQQLQQQEPCGSDQQGYNGPVMEKGPLRRTPTGREQTPPSPPSPPSPPLSITAATTAAITVPSMATISASSLSTLPFQTEEKRWGDDGSGGDDGIEMTTREESKRAHKQKAQHATDTHHVNNVDTHP